MSAARNHLLSFARTTVNARLYGDLDYYIAHTTSRGKIIEQLCSFIEASDKEWETKLAEKDREIAALKEQQNRFIEKALGLTPVAQPVPTPTTTGV